MHSICTGRCGSRLRTRDRSSMVEMHAYVDVWSSGGCELVAGRRRITCTHKYIYMEFSPYSKNQDTAVSPNSCTLPVGREVISQQSSLGHYHTYACVGVCFSSSRVKRPPSFRKCQISMSSFPSEEPKQQHKYASEKKEIELLICPTRAARRRRHFHLSFSSFYTRRERRGEAEKQGTLQDGTGRIGLEPLRDLGEQTLG